MTLTPEQIEWIVSEVVRRLREAGAFSGPHDSASDPVRPGATSPQQTLVLEDRLITLETLRDQTHNVRRLEVRTRAIVTPAVVDWLNDQNIELIRK